MKSFLSGRGGRRRLSPVRSSVWRRRLRVEALESRQFLSAVAVLPTFENVFAEPTANAARSVNNTALYGATPEQIRTAYGFNQVTFNNGTASVTGDGSQQTIAIVDAYGDSHIASDLRTFDAQFGLSNPTLSVVNEHGGTRLPSNNSGWALETALDVEWAHAMAPAAKLLLVEANTSSLSDLLTAVNYARQQPGVVAISMSWGSNEFSGETAYDGYFTTPANHVGVTFVAASGDNGSALWPAVSPNVLSVGGTTLNFADSSGDYGSETPWSGSGGGVSQFEPQPAYQSQSGLVSQSQTARTTPDVAYNGDPASGVAVYNSLSFSGQSGWFQVGGTSAAAPQWAAILAVADQGRQLANGGTANSLGNAQASLYQIAGNSTSYSSDFHDITSGSNGSGVSHTATVGYDLVTGLGTPKVAALVPALVQATTTSVDTTSTSSVKGGSGSPTTTLPNPIIVDLIILDLLTPAPTETHVPFVPLVNTAATPAPAPALSLVMPSEAPVQFATNSMLSDDPLSVPLTPTRRSSGSGDTPAEEEAPPSSPGASRAWDLFDMNNLGMSRTAGWSTSATATDSVFEEVGAAEMAAASQELALLTNNKTGQMAAALGLVAAALFFEKGSRRTDSEPALRTAALRQAQRKHDD